MDPFDSTLHQGSLLDNKLWEGYGKPLLKLQTLVPGTQWVLTPWAFSHHKLNVCMAEGAPDSPHSGRQGPAKGLLKALHQVQ